ncbi:MAG: hypothetical protein WBD40_23150 [Tepidisphaeraceae bacterium]
MTLVVFGDVLFHPGTRVLSDDGNDVELHDLWWRGFGFGELKAGRFPLWNPHVYGGGPFHAGLASALLYPPNWIELFLPTQHALNWFFAGHVFLAGLFTFWWCRARGLSNKAGVLGGVLFMLSGRYVLHIFAGHPTNIGAIAWVPLLLLAADKLADTGKWRWAVLGAAAAAMQIYAGHAQHFYYEALVGGVYALCHVVAARPGWRNRVKPLVAYAAIYGGAVLISAAQLFPALEAKSESDRQGGVPIEFAATFSFPPENVLTLVVPHVFGSAETYFGRAYLWEVSLFVSVTGLLLAGYALIQRDPRRRFALIMIVTSMILALGYHTPLFKLLYYYLPGFNTFRVTAKFTVPAVLFLAMLAGLGLDQLTERAKASAKPVITFVVVAAALLVGSLVIRAGLGNEDGGAWGALIRTIAESGESSSLATRMADPAFLATSGNAAADDFLLAAGTTGVVAALVWLLGRTRRAAYTIVALAMLEMIVFARMNVSTIEANPPLPAPWATVLDANPGDYRVLLGEARWADWGMVHGFQNLYGFDSSTITERFSDFLAFSQGLNVEGAGQYFTFTKFPPYLNMLRTRYVLNPQLNNPVIEVSDPLPHALLVSDYVIGAGRDDILHRIADPAFDPQRVVILESEPAIKPQPGGERGRVNVNVVSSDELHIEADVPAPTILLVTDNYSRLWRATPLSPGPLKAYDVLPANWVVRAIPLTAGKHHIRLRYEPRGVPLGFSVSGLTLAALAGAGVWTRFAPRFRSRRN